MLESHEHEPILLILKATLEKITGKIQEADNAGDAAVWANVLGKVAEAQVGILNFLDSFDRRKIHPSTKER